jgi:predicted GNAT family N-acyltransferase
MEPQTNPIPTTQIAEKMANTTFTFREITEVDELEQAFRLRYEVYSNSRNRVFINQNEFGLDLDNFDLHSNHYGIYSPDNVLIGYLRVVLDRNEYYNFGVFEIGLKFGIFCKSIHSNENIKKVDYAEYPFLSYPNLPESVKSKFTSLKNSNQLFAEASRLIIAENFRGFRTSAFLIECAMVLFIIICQGKRNAIVNCCKDHKSFYERYGFRTFSDEQDFNIFGMTKETLYLSTLPDNLPSKFEEMKAQYSITGKITKTL